MLGLGSGNGREAAVSRGRTIVSRLLVSGAAVLLLVSAGGCGAPGGQPSGTPTRTPGAVSIPTDSLSAHDQCMLAAGFRISAVESGYPGEPPLNVFSSDPNMDPQEAQARTEQCNALLPPPHIPTDAEIRATYDRWVGEYNCLLSLGYQPDSPPSVETFVASYMSSANDTGPWMPIDGVDTDRWTQTQYDQAKAKCTLEFLTAEGLPQQ